MKRFNIIIMLNLIALIATIKNMHKSNFFYIIFCALE